jgi:Carboxypeptidase regulatory-like domain
MMKNNTFILGLFIVFFSLKVNAQSKITGIIQDSITKKPIELANVLLRKQGQNTIIAYARTDAKGFYTLKFFLTQKNYVLSATHLGFTEKRTPFIVSDSSKTIFQQNIELTQRSKALEEVVVVERKSMVVRSDTITYRADAFRNGQERVAEDLLKNIPGLEIDSKGGISVNGKAIDRILIGGDDITDKNYKLLTKNLPANLVDEVQILDRFSNNPILKGIENSDKIALNLNLKKKVAFFGDVHAGYAPKGRYEARINIFSFVEKVKIYAIGSGNNVGTDPIGEIDFLTDFDFSMGEIETLKGYRSREKLNVNIVSPPSLSEQVSNINNVKLGALNAIFKTSKKLNFKVQAYFLDDKKQFYSSNFYQYLLGNESFNLSENYEITQKPSILYGKIESTYYSSQKSLLKYSGKIQQGNTDFLSNFSVNQKPLQEQLQNKDFYTEQFLNFTQKLSDRKALDIQFLYSHNSRPQTYFLNQGLYPELLDSVKSYQGIIQNFNNPADRLGILAKYIGRYNKGSYAWKIGFDYQDEKIVSALSVIRNNQENPIIGEFGNDVSFRKSWLYLELDYRYNLGSKVVLQSKINLNHTNYQYGNENQAKPFLTGSIGLNYIISQDQKLSWNVNYRNRFPEVTQLYPNYVLSNYRNFTRGTPSFESFYSWGAGLNYSMRNLDKQLYVNSSLNFSNQPEAYNLTNLLFPTYTFSGLTVGKGSNNYFAHFSIKKFLPFLKSGIKFYVQFNESNFQNNLNAQFLREVKSQNQLFKLSFRSAFDGFLNYDISTEQTISSFIIADNTNRNLFNNSYLYLFLKFSPKLNGTIKEEFHSFIGIKPFHVLGLEFDYQVIENTFSISLKGQNLLFNDRIEFSSNTDFSKNTNSYRLNQGFLMLSANYRF